MKNELEELAEMWLIEHYPKDGDIDPRWSAVLNFARYLTNMGVSTRRGGKSNQQHTKTSLKSK